MSLVERILAAFGRTLVGKDRLASLTAAAGEAEDWRKRAESAALQVKLWRGKAEKHAAEAQAGRAQISRMAAEMTAWKEQLSAAADGLDGWKRDVSAIGRETAQKLAEAYSLDAQCSAAAVPFARRLWELIYPVDVQGREFVRIGRNNDGGYIMVDDFSERQVAYSFGIRDDVSWDKAMAERGIPVYMYDPTIAALPEEHPLFHFSARGVCGEGETDSDYATLKDFLEANGHSEHTDIVLKMDVEGAEWESLLAFPNELLPNISQMVFELHNLGLQGGPGRDGVYMLAVLEKLRKHHEPVHIHINNNSRVRYLGGYPVPDALEITYVRRADHSFAPCARTFPTAIDQPCTHAFAEVMLTNLGGSAAPYSPKDSHEH